jgi:hypothetical protein
MLTRASAIVTRFAPLFAAASKKHTVPVELLMACALTESGPGDHPETSVRQEPGFLSD